jgi:hypothetical protein
MLDADNGAPSILDHELEDIAHHLIAAPGDIFAFREFGPYKLIRVLGESGMGVNPRKHMNISRASPASIQNRKQLKKQNSSSRSLERF